MTILDISSYDLPTLDPACMAFSGVSGVILGVFSPSDPPHDMARAGEALRKEGIDILGFYGLPYFGSAYGLMRDIKWATELAVDFKVDRVWVDCEIDAYQVGFTDLSPVTPGTRINGIRECVANIEGAKKSAGIYCCVPETRILTKELQWVPAGRLKVGDNIIGFDEELGERMTANGKRRAQRNYKEATVTYSDIAPLPVWKITLANGELITCTGEHKWLMRTSSGLNYKGNAGMQWVETRNIPGLLSRRNRKNPLVLPRFIKPWNGSNDRDEGYLSAAFDGEGSLYAEPNSLPRLSFAQKPNDFLTQVEFALSRKRFQWRREGLGKGGCHAVKINGGFQETMRFLGEMQPPRLLGKWRNWDIAKKMMEAIEYVPIVSVERAGVQEVARISSSSGTYIAEGFGAHNSAPWWWVPNTGNTTIFSHLPLWFANYGANDGTQPPLQVLPQSFGGWHKAAIHQYTSTLYVCGRNRDANYVFEEDDMPDPRTDEIIKALGGIEAIRAWNDNGNSLLAGYAIEQQDQNALEADVAKLKVSALPDHTHEPGGVIRD